MIPASLLGALGSCVQFKGRGEFQFTPVSGGDTCHAFKLEIEDESWFFKYVSTENGGEALRAEYASLVILAECKVPTPQEVHLVEGGDAVGLLMRFHRHVPWEKAHTSSMIEGLLRLYQSSPDASKIPSGASIGTVAVTQGPGLDLHNECWFHRFEPLIRRCASVLGKELTQNLTAFVQDRLPDFPQNVTWVHGDLWNGNVIPAENGEVIFIDPVTHICHPELDLAMMKLFGGFPQAVENALVHHKILSSDWENRCRVWQLIPALVHTAMFGHHYGKLVEELLFSRK